MPRLPHLVALAAVVLTACVGDIEDPAPGAAAPSSVPVVDAEGTCVELASGERVVGASPEGDLFVDQGSALRVVRRDGSESAVARPVGTLGAVAPESDVAATAIAGGELYRIDATRAVAVEAPASDMGVALDLCGGAGAGGPGFLAATGGLFEHDGTQWWRWTTDDGAPVGPIDRLASVEGACSDRSERLWLASDGRAVSVDFGASPSVRLDDRAPRIDALLRDPLVGPVALSGGRVLVGEAFEDARLDVAVDAVAAGGGAVWAVAGSDAYRLDGRAWREQVAARARGDADAAAPWSRISIALPDHAEVHALYADATGSAWLAGDAVACRREVGPVVVVRGALPFRPVESDPVALAVHASGTPTALEVTVDGTRVSAFEAPAGGVWNVGAVTLGSGGYHEIGLRVATETGLVERTITVRAPGTAGPEPAASWARDVRPIAQARCASCHGAASDVDLTTHAAWVARSETIWDRLGRWDAGTTGAMPPTGRLSDEELGRIRAWIDEGMEP